MKKNSMPVIFATFLFALTIAVMSASSASAAGTRPISAVGRLTFMHTNEERIFDFSVHTKGKTCDISGQDVIGCEGRGSLSYEDASGNSYEVDVRYVSGEGSEVWFAGPVIEASSPEWIGNWLFAQVSDKGNPGAGIDEVSGVFTNEPGSKFRVATHNQTGVGPYVIGTGNVNVSGK